MRQPWIIFALFLLFSCNQSKFDSAVTLPRLFSDGMVVQRDEAIRIWGKGIPGENVRVSLAGTINSGTVEEDSTWLLKLPKLPAGGPYKLEVNQIAINDVYVGDVWVAGGQSNMEWNLKSAVIGAQEEFDEGGFEEIRFFKVPNSYSAVPLEDVVGGSWKVADSVNMRDFSAVAWFFAKRNHLEKKVPVGVIESNWGGTPVEGWTNAEILAEMEGSFNEQAEDVIENRASWDEKLKANEMNRQKRDSMVAKPDSLLARQASAVSFDDSNWQRINLPSANPLQDIAWVRKEFRLNSTEGVSLHFPFIDQMAYLYLNGELLHYKNWGVNVPDLEIPSGMLSEGANVLSIRAINTWNNQPRIGAQGEMYLTQNEQKISLEGGWKYSFSAVEPVLPKVEWFNWMPGMMYNAMILPISQYSIRGFLWYQGESNAGRHEEYRALFSAMIKNWREIWDQGELPFLFVQLANFMERQEVQAASDWAFLREAQAQTLELPKTGMATIIDIGEADDIHPRNKKDVGERLWLLARKVSYGEDNLATGPVFKSLEISGQSLILSFGSVGKGLELKSGDQVKGFIIGKEGGKFEVAEAALVGKDKISIALPPGMESGEIRYAWADNPEVNLINHLGLPAVPFRQIFGKE
ncbi:sialate O-acetylesterase [Algoriphagus halophytocola]|uniref:Sialate O-acetylesterase n=1 Tax=Algoriphagus halophytocola TaxID=2991499 RepID=A0ABY6MJ48_9BACT|nr:MULTISPECIES: sialate O-acetylesterase [unclassified Algoriphagus]UZD23817.1 sialate O-acetylesterase [Algoriphagus sp. TR-M5]WBL41184.1 sialate O-acetylesterase [Algoriphagus sp. TR-M9]